MVGNQKNKKEVINLNVVNKENWEEEIEKITNMSSIKIHAFSDFAKDANDLKLKLEECYKKQISIRVKDSFINPNEYIEIIKMFDLAERQRIEEQKTARLSGIKRALELKKIGLGNYGRPSVELPSDFEEKINSYFKLKIPLENYRKQINMKKSTFYKYVNKVREN